MPRDYRQDLEKLMLLLGDRLVPLKAVAEVRRIESPMEIKSENGLLVAYVYITPKPKASMDKIVEEGNRRIEEKVSFPQGYFYT